MIWFVVAALIIIAIAMAITMPDWFIPSKGHLTTVVITPQVNTGGVLTDTTPVFTVTARLSRLNVALTPDKQMINTITSPRDNNVVLGDGWHIDVAALKINGGSGTGNGVDQLRAASLVADYFKLSWVEGTVAGRIETITCFASRGEYGADIASRGEVVAALGFDSVDVGATDFFKVVVS